ncbi:cbb3-type cytochrome c oxidase N-terminal domain-containing protein [Chryseobacterium sediminis]
MEHKKQIPIWNLLAFYLNVIFAKVYYIVYFFRSQRHFV